MPQVDPDDLLNIRDAAEQIGCSRTTLYRAIDDGRLDAVEVADRTMLHREDVASFEPKHTGARAQQGGSSD
jgi:excisionase family DNA binding protein